MNFLRVAWCPWSPAWRQHLWVLGVAGLLGGYTVVWCFGPDAADVDVLQAQVAQWQARVNVPPVATRSVSERVGEEPMPAWPGQDQAMAVWPWLQQRLQMQGLQVLALRPQGMGTSELPEQTVLLTLQGRWDDWLALTQHMAEQAPWWLPDHWQVVPASGGVVRLELLARVAWLPPALQDKGRRAWEGPAWPAASAVTQGAELFGARLASGSLSSPGAATGADIAPAVLSPDPRHWPVNALQLQGVWQQAGQWHAVLGAGLAQMTVHEGQRLGEGWRVRRVDRNGVTLTMGKDGPVQHLGWQGDKP